MNKNKRYGFTLIELLVVISIIAILMSILMPALSKVRSQAKQTICLSNLKQVAIGSLTYETDFGRLPTHLWETTLQPSGISGAIPMQVAIGSTKPGYDMREVYKNYVNVNYFKCPVLPKWEMDLEDVESSYNIYVDYFISGGYWANLGNSEDWSDLLGSNAQPVKLFTKSSQYWTYGGKRFNVLYGDSLWKYLAGDHLRTNHPVANGGFNLFEMQPPNTSRWAASFYLKTYSSESEADDLLPKLKSNFVFADGSANAFSGDDDRMVEMYHRRDKNYTFYIPSK